MSRKPLDLVGQTFGKLTVVKRIGSNAHGTSMWLCECECGETSIVLASNLMYGTTRSCGCMMGHRTHGMSETKAYKEWEGMKKRCYTKSEQSYKLYGGRGIEVCDVWKNDFRAFYNDVSTLPHFNEPGYSLDRIDNDGNYEPGNVRWADRIAQANNKRNNVMITYNGETHTRAEWARIVGINWTTLRDRINRYGWSVEDALTMPVRRR